MIISNRGIQTILLSIFLTAESLIVQAKTPYDCSKQNRIEYDELRVKWSNYLTGGKDPAVKDTNYNKGVKKNGTESSAGLGQFK